MVGSSEVSVEESDRRRKQEESLRKFRMRECNLLVAGATNLEVGVDNVKSNLVVALEPPTTFKTFVQYKVKAKSPRSWFLIFQDEGGGSIDALSGLANTSIYLYWVLGGLGDSYVGGRQSSAVFWEIVK